MAKVSSFMTGKEKSKKKLAKRNTQIDSSPSSLRLDEIQIAGPSTTKSEKEIKKDKGEKKSKKNGIIHQFVAVRYALYL